jgi:hypothetical protein
VHRPAHIPERRGAGFFHDARAGVEQVKKRVQRRHLGEQAGDETR